jgi:chemotaxis response regulator CheB
MEPRFTSQPNNGLWVIGLVASSDGLDALTQVLAPLPADFPAAIVALQHTRPEHPSRLANILDRHTALCVQPAGHGDRLQPGLVLVAPTRPPHPGLPRPHHRPHPLRADPAVAALGRSAVDLDGPQLRCAGGGGGAVGGRP